MNLKLNKKSEKIFTSVVTAIPVPCRPHNNEWVSNWQSGEPLFTTPFRRDLNIIPKYFDMNKGVDCRMIVKTTDDKYLLVVAVKQPHYTDYVTVDNTCVDPTRIKSKISISEFNRDAKRREYAV